MFCLFTAFLNEDIVYISIFSDYVDKRLYWIDAKHHKIGTSLLTGDDHVVVLTDAKELSHPFSIAVFEVRLLWEQSFFCTIFLIAYKYKANFVKILLLTVL